MLAEGGKPGAAAGRDDTPRRVPVAGLISLLLGLALASIAAHAGLEQGPVFRTLSVNEGLPDRRVEAIVQDAHGFIWIGTRGGLVRHEGQRMRFIPSDPENPDPLPGRNIMSLMAHSDGTVWAGVENRGVVQIGPDIKLRRHLEPEQRGGRLPAGNIWSMAEDCDGRVWMAFMRGGVAVYDPATDELTSYPQSEEAGLNPGGFQVHLEVDSRCRVWLIQTSQVSVMEPEDSRFRAIRVTEQGKFAFHLTEAKGRIYFSEGSEVYDLGSVDEAPHAQPRRIADVDAMVTAIAPDPHSGELVIASTIGLYRKLPDPDATVRAVRHQPGLANGLPSDAIDSASFDREGGLWLTTTRSGAAYLPPGSAAFERYQPVPGRQGPDAVNLDPVMSLTWDEESRGFWIGGLRGDVEFLALADREEPLPTVSEAVKEALSGAAVLEILREGDTLYFATQKSVVRAALGEDGAHQVLMTRGDLASGTFSTLQRKNERQLWIATQDVGLFLLDESTGEREHFHPDGEARRFLPETAPREIMRGPDGAWWLIAPGGVYRWSEEQGFVRQEVPATRPLASAAWLDDELWLATDQSIQLWRREGDSLVAVRQYDLEGRLPPGRVIEIVADALGDIWLMRTSGLSLLRVADGRVRHFSQRDGMAAVEFGENTAVTLPNGTLAFGGRGGIITVDPGRISRVSVAPKVHVTRVQAGDRIVELDPVSSTAIELEHDHNNLFIDFLATSYLATERTRYRVKLEGWDTDWIELIGQTRHHYSNLPPGRYRFVVQAAAPDGPWSREGDALPVEIRQPPWLSGWALAAYALLALTGTGAGLRGYRRANQRRREVREARQKRDLAEQQRKIITRLNHSLEPLELAATIAREIVQVTGGHAAWLGYVDEHLPRDLVATDPERDPLTREQWRRRLEAAADGDDLALTLRVGDRDIARVLVEALPGSMSDEDRERLRLLEEMAAQALHNALLLQRVRALAERAEQASNAKSEFLATMSHEIRTPLHGVLGMVELLYETETEPGQQDILDTLRQSGLQLQRIIDDVLDISRIEAGRMSLNEQPFDLAAMLEQVVDLHAPNAARKGLDLRLRIAADLPLSASGDSDRISQVLGNLLSNAVKFTERGGIELSAAAGRDGQLVLVVSDSGPGISARDRDRLFEPFTQLDASITRSYSGSGLGLAICRRLVDAMGGPLDLLNGCHGGSRFRVRLPAHDAPTETSGPALSSMLQGQVVGASVPTPTLRVLQSLARRWGIRVVDARRRARPCDLLLVDPQTLDETDADRLDAWRQQAEALAWLQSPFPSHSGPPPLLPKGAHFLRWPLVESRFVGLLFDLRIGGADAGGSSG
jgi:signal transduction histidine kinase/ligand-binding sensor domain-containing protein